jgi:hypothetical protein
MLRARGPTVLSDAGFSWEHLAGWLPGGMDAEAWEMAVPSMGVMALVRNLHNFDQAGISEAAVDTVIAKVTDPAEVARARLFPYQVWGIPTVRRALLSAGTSTTRWTVSCSGALWHGASGKRNRSCHGRPGGRMNGRARRAGGVVARKRCAAWGAGRRQ